MFSLALRSVIRGTTNCGLVLVLQVLFESSMCLGQLLGIGSATPCRPTEGTIPICAGASLGLLVIQEVSSKGSQPGHSDMVTVSDMNVIVMSDLRVDGMVAIAKGTAVRTSVESRAAHITAKPGHLTMHATEVPAVTGQAVILTGGTRAFGTLLTSCDYEVFCYLSPATQAKIKAGTLILAQVESTVQLDRKALVESAHDPKEPRAQFSHVYLYTNVAPPGLFGPRLRVLVDGKPGGWLGSFEYSCVSLMPGPHHMSLAGAIVSIDVAPDQDYFVRAEQLPGNQEIITQLTPGFDSESEVLAPGHPEQSMAGDCRVPQVHAGLWR